MMVSFVLSFFPRGVLDGILGLVGSVSEDFPSCFCNLKGDFYSSFYLRSSFIILILLGYLFHH